ncbi:hypothetical protein F5Y18DRAFT_427772 [Xylariaceae sp. FL1019]|nr:hypothetical protein F5Y18DRAFT_427772 [Xylariaceae sp. FL1019]
MTTNTNQMPNFYEVLGLQHDASVETITSAFHELQSAYVTKLNTVANITEKMAADQSFWSVYQAYQILRHPVWRAQYDTHLTNISADNVQSQSQYEITQEHAAVHAELLKCQDLSDRFFDLFDKLSGDNAGGSYVARCAQDRLVGAFMGIAMEGLSFTFFWNFLLRPYVLGRPAPCTSDKLGGYPASLLKAYREFSMTLMNFERYVTNADEVNTRIGASVKLFEAETDELFPGDDLINVDWISDMADELGLDDETSETDE